MEIQDVLKKLEIIIEEVDKEIYEKSADKDTEVLLDNTWLHGYLKCAWDLKLEIEEELNNERQCK